MQKVQITELLEKNLVFLREIDRKLTLESNNFQQILFEERDKASELEATKTSLAKHDK